MDLNRVSAIVTGGALGLGRARTGRAPEFAPLALELLTNDYLNGEVIRIDGAARLPPR